MWCTGTVTLAVLAAIECVLAQQASRPFSLTDSLLDFTTDLAADHLSPGNYVFSPFSVVSVLNLLLLGATGNTLEQLRHALRYPFEVDELLIHQQSGIQLDSLKQDRRGINVQIANRVFVDTGFSVEQEYRNAALDYYQARVEQLPFGRNSSRAQSHINEWVDRHTAGKIRKLLEAPPQANTRMIGANVVYFNGAWATPFNPQHTKQLKWHLTERDSTRTTMMFAQLDVPHASYPAEGFSALALPYEGGRYSMLILLPDEAGERPLASLERTLSAARLRQVFADMRTTSLSVWLPKFKLEHSLALRDVLQALGATDLFQESRASFGRMSADRQLFLSEVLHRAVIEVHEVGTEAAAATVTLVNRDRLGKEFRANRPFVFAILDNKTGVPLFWGRIVRPVE